MLRCRSGLLPGRELLEGGEGGSGTQNFVLEKWPDQIVPVVNFVLSHNGYFFLGGGVEVVLPPPPAVYGHSNFLAPWAFFVNAKCHALECNKSCFTRGFSCSLQQAGGGPRVPTTHPPTPKAPSL